MRGKLVIAGASAIVGIGVSLVGTTEPVAAHHAFAAEIRRGTTCGVPGHGDASRVDQSSRLDPRRRDERRRLRGAVGLRSRHTERVVQTRLYAPVASAWCGSARRRLSSKGWHQSGEWPRHHVHRWNQTVPRVVGHRRPLRARPTRGRYRRPASLTTANWRTSQVYQATDTKLMGVASEATSILVLPPRPPRRAHPRGCCRDRSCLRDRRTRIPARRTSASE